MLFTDYLMYLIEERQRAVEEVKLKDLVYSNDSLIKSAIQQKVSAAPAACEYKLIAPKTVITQPAGRLTSIMSQHLYLATPVKLNTQHNSGVAVMNSIVSCITKKIIEESKVATPVLLNPADYCVKTGDKNSTIGCTHNTNLSECQANIPCDENTASDEKVSNETQQCDQNSQFSLPVNGINLNMNIVPSLDKKEECNKYVLMSESASPEGMACQVEDMQCEASTETVVYDGIYRMHE